MKERNWFLIVYLLPLMLVPSVLAQVNPVYQRMIQNGWKYPFENGFRKPTPPELDSESCKTMGYTDSTVANLKEMGVDLLERWKIRPWDEKMWTALSDCIVIGTVSKIEHPSWPIPWYHTVAYVQVEEFLRNDYGLPKAQVAVLEVSGPTGRPGERVTRIGEDTLNIGEHVLLFLSGSGLITTAALNSQQNLYNYLINDSNVWFEMLARYDIQSDQLLSKREKQILSLSQMRNEIGRVLSVIHRTVPVDK